MYNDVETGEYAPMSTVLKWQDGTAAVLLSSVDAFGCGRRRRESEGSGGINIAKCVVRARN